MALMLAPSGPLAALVACNSPGSAPQALAMDGSPGSASGADASDLDSETIGDASGSDGGLGLDASLGDASSDGPTAGSDAGTTHSQCTKPTSGWWGLGSGQGADQTQHLFAISSGSDGWVADLGSLTDGAGGSVNLTLIATVGSTLYALGSTASAPSGGIFRIDPNALTVTLDTPWSTFTQAPSIPSFDAFGSSGGAFLGVKGSDVYCIETGAGLLTRVGVLPGGVDTPPYGVTGTCDIQGNVNGDYSIVAIADHGGLGCSFFSAHGSLAVDGGYFTHSELASEVGSFYNMCGPGSAGLVGSGTIAQGGQGLIKDVAGTATPYRTLRMCYSEDSPNALNGVRPKLSCIAGN